MLPRLKTEKSPPKAGEEKPLYMLERFFHLHRNYGEIVGLFTASELKMSDKDSMFRNRIHDWDRSVSQFGQHRGSDMF